ncbi:hypothetical protein D3C81_1342520 [compost metagenome]
MLHPGFWFQFVASAHLPGFEPAIERGSADSLDSQFEGVGEGGIGRFANLFAIKGPLHNLGLWRSFVAGQVSRLGFAVARQDGVDVGALLRG